MAVDWGKMAKSVLNSETWEESLGIWKMSNVLGWYMSNYGAIKTQFMLGVERKINMLYKYEWYMTQPTKVLLNGEGKIDLEKISRTTPWYNHGGLMFTSLGSTHTVETLNNEVKAEAETRRIEGGTTETHGTHIMNVTGGNSTETIALGAKTIRAPTGGITMEAPMINLTGVTGNSIALEMGGIMTITGTTINIG